MKKNIAYLFLFLFINSPTYSQNWIQEKETVVGNDSGNPEIELDVSNRKDGIFFKELLQGDKKLVRKIIKK